MLNETINIRSVSFVWLTHLNCHRYIRVEQLSNRSKSLAAFQKFLYSLSVFTEKSVVSDTAVESVKHVYQEHSCFESGRKPGQIKQPGFREDREKALDPTEETTQLRYAAVPRVHCTLGQSSYRQRSCCVSEIS